MPYKIASISSGTLKHHDKIVDVAQNSEILFYQ